MDLGNYLGSSGTSGLQHMSAGRKERGRIEIAGTDMACP